MTSNKVPLVSYESVALAYRQLREKGVRPSVRKIKDHLGGGSPNDISLFLNQVKSSSDQITTSETNIDPKIIHLIEEHAKKAAIEARAESELLLAEAKADMQELAKAGQQSEILIEELNKQLDQATAQTQLLLGRIEQLLADKELLEAKSKNDSIERERLLLELNRAEVRLESMKSLEIEMQKLRDKYEKEREARVEADVCRAALQAKLDGIQEERASSRNKT